MKTVFMGTTKLSEELLRYLIEEDIDIQAIFTMPELFNISYSNRKVKNYNYADLGDIARQHKVPCYEIDSVPGKKITDYADVILSIKPDIILALGWYYMVPKKIRELAKYGTWGIHASLLPKYAGGAPLVWAMIYGERETGVTLFRLEDGVDDGDIIEQKSFLIEQDDTIKTVYQKAIDASKVILLKALKDVFSIQFTPQDKSRINVFPQRTPDDGIINWNKSAVEIYNFIRAQTEPYPGAFCKYKEKKLIVWDVEICNANTSLGKIPGRVTFVDDEKGYIGVETNDGVLKIKDMAYGDYRGVPGTIINAKGEMLE